MNEERLRIYLSDHLSAFSGERELVQRCRSENSEGPLADLLERLGAELEDQQRILRDVLKRIGGSESRLKQGIAWVAEKAGRLKLNDSLLQYSPLSRVLELEALSAAALERTALWETLDTVAAVDPRLEGTTFSFFQQQSQAHLDELLAQRRLAIQQAF